MAGDNPRPNRDDYVYCADCKVHVAKRYLKSVEPDFFDDDDAKKTTCPEGHEIKAAS